MLIRMNPHLVFLDLHAVMIRADSSLLQLYLTGLQGLEKQEMTLTSV